MQRIVAIHYDVSGQPIGPTFKRQEIQEKASEQQISQLLRGGSLKTRIHFWVYISLIGTCN
jgi:hypothetical protein